VRATIVLVRVPKDFLMLCSPSTIAVLLAAFNRTTQIRSQSDEADINTICSSVRRMAVLCQGDMSVVHQEVCPAPASLVFN
jgi:hypothetical protein